VTHLIFFILFGAGMYFFGAIVGSSRVKQRLIGKVGVRLISLNKVNSIALEEFRMGFISGMKWAVNQVMDEPVNWEKLEEVVNERMGM
jgi:hypothetical protein